MFVSSQHADGTSAPFDRDALIPIIDLMNHDNSADHAEAFSYDNGTEGKVLFAANDRGADEQVFLNYGAHCNTLWELTHGFTPENNSQQQCNDALGY
jgi:hypothetical protein